MLMSCGISEGKYVTQVSSDTFRSVISCSSSGKLDVTEKLRVLHMQCEQTKELICNGVKSSAALFWTSPAGIVDAGLLEAKNHA